MIFSGPSKAGYIVTFQPDGLGNVVANGAGTLNLTALTTSGRPANTSSFVIPQQYFENTGPTSNSVVVSYSGSSFGSNFGPGSATIASSGSGNLVGISQGAIFVPQGYVSGSALADSSTYNGTTIAGLGLTPGTYVSTWGSGATADSFTVVVTNTPFSSPGVTPTPAPPTLGLVASGAVGLLAWRRRRWAAS